MKPHKITAILLAILNIHAHQAHAAYGLEATQILHYGQTLAGWIRNYNQLADSYIRAGEQLLQQTQISQTMGLIGSLREVADLTNQVTEAVTHMPSTIGTDIINLGFDTLDTYNHVVATFSRGERLYDKITGKEQSRFGPDRTFLSGQDLSYRMSAMRSDMSSDFLSKSKTRGEQFQKWSKEQETQNRSIIAENQNAIKLQGTQAKAAVTTNSILTQQAQMQARAEERAALDQLAAEAEKQHQLEINKAKYGKSMTDVINSLPH